MFELLTVWPEPVMPSSPFALLALAVLEPPQLLKRAATASVKIKAKVRRIDNSSCAGKGKLLKSNAQAFARGLRLAHVVRRVPEDHTKASKAIFNGRGRFLLIGI